jgi:hypothetical protein
MAMATVKPPVHRIAGSDENMGERFGGEQRWSGSGRWGSLNGCGVWLDVVYLDVETV